MAGKLCSQNGFSLVQMSITLTVITVMTAAVLPGGEMNFNAQTDLTMKRMVAIEHAIRGYRTANGGRLPCPASGALNITDNNFGREIGSLQTIASAALSNLCVGADYTPDNATASLATLAAGMVPVRTLNLPEEYALDGYGRRFTYVVDKRATQGSDLLGNNPIATVAGPLITITHPNHGLTAGQSIIISGATSIGTIPASSINGNRSVFLVLTPNTYTVLLGAIGIPAVGGGSAVRIAAGSTNCLYLSNGGTPGIKVYNTQGGSLLANATTAIISHGKNGHGAYPINGSALAARINAGSTNTDELYNASLTSGFAQATHQNFIKKAWTTDFDDIVRYGVNCQ